jgi:hemerythrin-like metal-binding protein
MTLIEWRDELQVGIPEVDDEHRALVDLINRLYAQLKAGQSPATIVDFLGELYASVARHFANEEEIMKSHEHVYLEEHAAEHKQLLDDICNMIDDYQDGVLNDDRQMADRLDDWFCIHFKTQDVRLHELSTQSAS